MKMPIEVANQCKQCGTINCVRVTEDSFSLWQNGELAENAFPYCSEEEREHIISGTCKECWS